MKAFIPNFETKLQAFGVAPEFNNEFRKLIEEGTVPGKRLGTLLRYARNYKDCLKSILVEITRQHIAEKVA